MPRMAEPAVPVVDVRRVFVADAAIAKTFHTDWVGGYVKLADIAQALRRDETGLRRAWEFGG